jgi:hypothetical protein
MAPVRRDWVINSTWAFAVLVAIKRARNKIRYIRMRLISQMYTFMGERCTPVDRKGSMFLITNRTVRI